MESKEQGASSTRQSQSLTVDLLGPKGWGFGGVFPVGFQNNGGQRLRSISHPSSLQVGVLIEVPACQLHYYRLGEVLVSDLLFQLTDPFLMKNG